MKAYHVPRVSDDSVVRLVRDLISNDDDDGVANITVIDHLDLTLNSGDGIPAQWKSTLVPGSYLISTASASIPKFGMTVTFYRGKTQRPNINGQPSWQPGDNPFVDGLQIDGPNSDVQAAIPLLSIIQKFMQAVPPFAGTDPSVPALDQSAAILNRVTEAVATLTEHTAERQKSLDATRHELEQHAEAQLEARRGDLESGISQLRAQLADEARGLEAREKELDDRENTHVRRELQRSMAKLSTDALSGGLLVKSRNTYLLTVATPVILAIFLLVLTVWQSSVLTAASAEVLLFHEGRIVLQSVFAAVLIWFGLRQATARHRHISKWENDLHRFRLDTERASFLIEGDLEARKVNAQGLPEVMLDRFSRGLFGADSPEHQQDQIGETLNVLFNRAASVKFGTDGFEASLDKASIRKARKDSESKAEE